MFFVLAVILFVAGYPIPAAVCLAISLVGGLYYNYKNRDR